MTSPLCWFLSSPHIHHRPNVSAAVSVWTRKLQLLKNYDISLLTCGVAEKVMKTTFSMAKQDVNLSSAGNGGAVSTVNQHTNPLQ